MATEPQGPHPFQAWWRRRSWPARAGVVVGAPLLALLLIGLAVPAPEPEGEDIGRGATTTVVVTETVEAETTEPPTPAPPSPPPPPPPPVLGEVVDGDTIRLEDGTRVRLLQIDAPELDEGECYAARSRRALERLVPPGTRVRLAADPKLDRRDRYGRALRYLFRGRRNVNLRLVREGAAAPYFFEGERGRFAASLVTAAEQAAAAGRGLWGACEAELDPFDALVTRKAPSSAAPPPPSPPPPSPPPPPPPPPPAPSQAASCHASYRGACLDPNASDYDCAGGSGDGPEYTGYVRVVGPDEYDLDRDGDGAGCED